MLNTPQYVISLYGILKAGAVVAGINPLLSDRELEFILNDSEAETIITLDLFHPRVEEVKGKTKLKNVIITGLGDFLQDGGPLPEPQEKEGPHSFSPYSGSIHPNHPRWKSTPKRSRHSAVNGRHNRPAQGRCAHPPQHCE